MNKPAEPRNIEISPLSNQTEDSTQSERAAGESDVRKVSITIDSVAHRFGARHVFKPINAQVCAGQLLLIRGMNGAGKSTLLRIIAGLLNPAQGKVHVSVGGHDLDIMARKPFIGYVAPDMTLYKELTGAENLEFFASLHGIRLAKDDLISSLTNVGLRGRGRDLVGAYSSGMRQRLKYAFALLHSPPILLLDEPTANLDVDGVAIVERIIQAQQERARGGLTIVATNEPRELTWSRYCVHLEPGP